MIEPLKPVYHEHGVLEMACLPIQAVILQGTCKIIHHDFRSILEVFEHQRKRFIPAFSIWHNVGNVAQPMFAEPSEYATWPPVRILRREPATNLQR